VVFEWKKDIPAAFTSLQSDMKLMMKDEVLKNEK
jgi:hypothetical protein